MVIVFIFVIFKFIPAPDEEADNKQVDDLINLIDESIYICKLKIPICYGGPGFQITVL